MQTVPIPHGDSWTVRKAVEWSGLSDETIRRWCRLFGIGGRYRAGEWQSWAYRVSWPALRMVMAKDFAALEAFRAGDRVSPLVTPWLDKTTM